MEIVPTQQTIQGDIKSTSEDQKKLALLKRSNPSITKLAITHTSPIDKLPLNNTSDDVHITIDLLKKEEKLAEELDYIIKKNMQIIPLDDLQYNNNNGTEVISLYDLESDSNNGVKVRDAIKVCGAIVIITTTGVSSCYVLYILMHMLATALNVSPTSHFF
jgi:hypothetical protein